MSVPALRFPEFDGEWEASTIGDSIVTMRGGAPLAPVDFVEESEFEVIPKKAISEGGRLRLDSAGTFTTSTFFQKYDKSQVDSSYLITTLRDLVPSGPSIGFIVEFSSEKTYLLAQGVYGFVLEQKKLCREFLILFSNRIEYRREMQRIMVGSTQVHVRNGDFKKVAIAVPSLPEQKKIAAFLGVVDEKLAGLRARRDGLETYKRGLMQKLFSRTLRFTKACGSAFPDWEEKRLGEVSTKNDSGIYKSRDLYGSGQNIVGVSDLFSTHAIDGQTFREVPLSEEELAKNTLMEGDILYAESSLVRAGIAKAVYVTAQGAGTAFAWHTRRFSIDPTIANSAFIFYYLESPIARKYIEAVATQTALTGITTKDYFKTPVPIPRPEEQTLIANALQAMDAKIQAVSDQITRMEGFKKGLLQQMFV